MQVASDLTDRYVAVWNEPDRDTRRRRIEGVWAPDGATCYRLLDACGHEAIEARVAGSWERWLREGKYIFRPVRAIAHDKAIRFEFAMVATAAGRIEAQGLCYLLLDRDGRIARDYQFNPTVNDAADLADKYLTPWNEADAGLRQRLLADHWTTDCAYFDGETETRGLAALAGKMTEAHRSLVAARHVLASAQRSQRHHNVAHIAWQTQFSDGRGAGRAGSTLLVMDENRRIAAGYQFDATTES
jgi:hypothetical protein